MKFLILLVLICAPTWAQIKHQTRISKPIPGKSKEEIKDMVLFNGAMDGIKESAERLGYDHRIFLTNLEKRFEVYFEALKEHELTTRYGKEHAKLKAEEKKPALDDLLNRKDSLFRKFAGARQVVSSYTVKNGVVELNLDKTKMEKLLKKFISPGPNQYSKLWILGEVVLDGMTWEGFQLVSEESFREPIEASWLKWMGDHMLTNVEEAGICRGPCRESYGLWEQEPQDEALGSIGPDYLNGIWAKVTVNLRKKPSSSFVQETVFEWDGRIVLIDVNTKRLLATQELPTEKKIFRNADQKKMNSDLASLMYRSGVSGFTNLLNVLKDQKALNRVKRLTIVGHKHLLDIQQILEELKTRGAALGLDAKIDFFRSQEAQILCFYQGEEKSFIDLFSQLKELKLSQSYKVVNEFNGVHHVIRLVTP